MDPRAPSTSPPSPADRAWAAGARVQEVKVSGQLGWGMGNWKRRRPRPKAPPGCPGERRS